jgi:hypothetical protein
MLELTGVIATYGLFLLLVIAINLIVEIWLLKFSSEKAYRRKTSWGEAFSQWLWMFGLRLMLWLIVLILFFWFSLLVR